MNVFRLDEAQLAGVAADGARVVDQNLQEQIALIARQARRRQRPLVTWVATMTVTWGLVAILFVSWVDVGKSYRGMIANFTTALPAKYSCISSLNVGEPQRAMLQYFAGIVTWRIDVPGRKRSDCDLMLVQGVASEETVPLGAWHKIWEGTRPGDKVERYRLYRRIDSPAAKH